MRKPGILALGMCACVWLLLVAASAWAGPGGDWLNQWEFRVPVTVSNPSGATVSGFQVKVALNGSFNFGAAESDGRDLRATTSDGSTLIPFWIESWNPGGSSAAIWVRVPSIPASGTTIYLYYGNPDATAASSGDATFEFFDDFASSGPGQQGYFQLGSAQTVLATSQAWETSPPHTLSVVQRNTGGHTYWGYYGLTTDCGGVGLAFSEDLVNWEKSTNPLFTDGRWPSVIQVGGTLYMAYTKGYCTVPQIMLASSTDGVTWTDVKTLVAAGHNGLSRNQNPHLWLNPNDGQFYLFWYNGNDSNVFNIRARSAASPEGLDSTTSEVNILSSPTLLAAPNMLYHGGTYFLSTEIFTGGIWAVQVYGSTTSPTSGFSVLPNNPVLPDNSACMFQQTFGTTLHVYYCKISAGVWVVDHRSADLTVPRPVYFTLDPVKWTSSGGNWNALSALQSDGSTGPVAQANTTGRQILYSSFSGADYVLEAFGKQVAGNVWGPGFRVQNPNNFYSVNLYEHLDGSPNLHAYAWIGNDGSLPATLLGSAAVGTVQPNVWHKLTVKVQSNAFDIFKDGVLQIHSSDGSLLSGGVALYGENGTAARYDQVLVRKFAAQDPATTAGPFAQENPGPVFDDCDDDDDHRPGHRHKPRIKCHPRPHGRPFHHFWDCFDSRFGRRRLQIKHKLLDYRPGRGGGWRFGDRWD